MTTDALAKRASTSNGRQTSLRALMITFSVMAAFFVALRFLSRMKRGVRLGLDDWLLLTGQVNFHVSSVSRYTDDAQLLLFCLLTCGLLSKSQLTSEYGSRLTCIVIHWGLGIHAANVPAVELIHMAKVCMLSKHLKYILTWHRHLSLSNASTWQR